MLTKCSWNHTTIIAKGPNCDWEMQWNPHRKRWNVSFFRPSQYVYTSRFHSIVSLSWYIFSVTGSHRECVGTKECMIPFDLLFCFDEIDINLSLRFFFLQFSRPNSVFGTIFIYGVIGEHQLSLSPMVTLDEIVCTTKKNRISEGSAWCDQMPLIYTHCYTLSSLRRFIIFFWSESCVLACVVPLALIIIHIYSPSYGLE